MRDREFCRGVWSAKVAVLRAGALYTGCGSSRVREGSTNRGEKRTI
jgi:hypothetical protein